MCKPSDADSKPSALTDAEFASNPTVILSTASPLTTIPKLQLCGLCPFWMATTFRRNVPNFLIGRE